jgi:iron(III) transport system substrate-binding protein
MSRFTGAAFILLCLSAGCEPATTSGGGTQRGAPAGNLTATAPTEREVVVYTALDRQFSEPIFAEFTAQTGIRTLPVYDTESTKTVGLTNRIRAEAGHPRCDVFWNNEILNTLRLKDEGLLQPCRPAEGLKYPAAYRDADGYWYGFAARARVILVNTELVSEADRPASIRALAEPRFRGRAGIAKPLFGTTASHVACLFATLGPADARQLLGSFKANDVQVVAGNKTCAELVGRGRLAIGLTDTDDALIELEAGRPVVLVFPDQEADAMGTLLLPNTLALIRGAPHPQAALELMNYLLSPAVEERLARGPAGQIPLHPAAAVRSRATAGGEVRPLPVDFAEAARQFAPAAAYIEQEFLAGT